MAYTICDESFLNLKLLVGWQNGIELYINLISKIFYHTVHIFLTYPCFIAVGKWNLISSFGNIRRCLYVDCDFSRVHTRLSFLVENIAAQVLIIPPRNRLLYI